MSKISTFENDDEGSLSKFASIINRFGQIYFDKEMKGFGIGSGQQFFLMIINDYPGISQFKLARVMGFDKGTTAKAVKKLEDKNYIIRETDSDDKRINRLFVSKEAQDVIKTTISAKEKWYQILTEGMTVSEIENTKKYMRTLSENAYSYIKKDNWED